MLTENTLTTRRWPLVAAAAAVVAIAIAGIALVNRGDNAELPADPPTPTVPPTPDPGQVDEQTPDEQQPIDAAVLPLPAEGQMLPPGRYSVDTLGVPIEFDVPPSATSWTVMLNNPLAFLIGTDQGYVAMQRPGSYPDAEQAQDPDRRDLGNIPPDDPDAWIEATGLIVEASSETTVAGRPAKFRQVRVPDGSGEGLCPAESLPCMRASSVSADAWETESGNFHIMEGASGPSAFWNISLDDFEPIGILAVAPGGDLSAWLEAISPLVDSMTLGQPGPAVDGGTARVARRETFAATYRVPRGPGLTMPDGTIVRSDVTTLTGDLTGEIRGVGVEFTPANGSDDLVFSGTIDGLGAGTLVMHQEWTGDPSGNISVTTVVTGGTGDFAGVTGRVGTNVGTPDESRAVPIYTGDMTFNLTIPANESVTDVPTTALTVAGPYSGVRTDGEQLADGSTAVTYLATAEGAITGDIVGSGSWGTDENGQSTGSDKYAFTGTIDGIGTGTLVYTDDWASETSTGATITTSIVGGTGDFVGITGLGVTTVDTSNRDGAVDVISGTNTFDFVVPQPG